MIGDRMKAVFRTALHRAGFDVVRWLEEGHLLKQVSRLMEEQCVSEVLDIGANRGQWAQTVRSLGYRGNIYSFEPVKGAFRSLDAATSGDDQWTAINCAIGEEPGEVMMHVSENLQSSSILPMLPKHRDAAPRSGFIRKEPVRMRTLDSVVDELHSGDGRMFMKVDVQGYGSQVLAGAKLALSRMVGLQIELSLVPLYSNEPLIEEMIGQLRGAGFVPVSFEPNFYDTRSGHVLQVDGLFIAADR